MCVYPTLRVTNVHHQGGLPTRFGFFIRGFKLWELGPREIIASHRVGIRFDMRYGKGLCTRIKIVESAIVGGELIIATEHDHLDFKVLQQMPDFPDEPDPMLVS
jgi:hypothetical protein